MFALTPRRKERMGGTLIPRMETPFRLFHEEFEPLLERFFRGWPAPWAEMWEWPVSWGLEMTENEKEVVFRAELPGFELAEINVLLRGNELTIEAKHGEEPKAKEKEATEKEIKEPAEFAHVRRTATLPEGLELEKAEATYRNGVLEVRIPRLPEAMGRRVEVKT